jgi:hypothetical protein
LGAGQSVVDTLIVVGVAVAGILTLQPEVLAFDVPLAIGLEEAAPALEEAVPYIDEMAPEAEAVAPAAQEAETAIANYWPPNNGAWGPQTEIYLEPGTQFQRVGGTLGTYVSKIGTPREMLSLPYDKINQSLHIFEVVKPIPVMASKALPWFGQVGFGNQYVLPVGLQTLLDRGIVVPGG